MLIALNEKTQTATLDTCAVHSFSPHRRVLTRGRWFSNLLRATTSFHTRPYDWQFLQRKWTSTNKNPFYYNSDKRWAVNMKNWEMFLLFSLKSSMFSVIKPRWSQLFHIALAISANILTSVQDFFVFKQPINVPQSPSILVPSPAG